MSRFKVYYQHDAMQCGIACLQMICRHYGVDYSLAHLSKICFATNEGVSLLGISEAATDIGLRTVCMRLTVDQLCMADLPCIIHWNQNHFVVLYKVSKDGRKFYVADPARGRVKYSREEFEAHWLGTHQPGEETGIAMTLEPMAVFSDLAEHKVYGRESHSLKYLSRYVWMYRRYFFQIILGLVAGCLMQLLLPFLTQSIVDVGIRDSNIGFIWLVLIGEFVLMTSRTLIDFIRRWLLLHVNMRINLSLVSDFVIKLMRLPMWFFDTKQTGDILQRMNDHGRVNTFLTQQTVGIAFSAITFVVFGSVLLFYNALIFIVFIAGSAAYAGWLVLFLERRKQLDYEQFEKQADSGDKTYELVTSMQEIKLQSCQRRRRWEWEDAQAELYGVQMKALRLQQTQEAGSMFINELKNIVITVVAATAVIDGSMTLGMMLAVQYIIGQLEYPVSQLVSFIYSLQDVRISLERINEVNDVMEEGLDLSLMCDYWDKSDGIRLENVSFKYDPHSPAKTVDDITFNIPRGKVTAIVGASGSGKTTLLKLMLGYYEADSGKVMIGGATINNIHLEWWRRRCGVVMQDGVVFSESIARNIAVTDGTIDWPRVKEAARIACIDDYVMSLPLKYDTKVGRNGMGLSQGQKQRILIARAVYKNPDFLILDEATNSLDAKNERMIVDNLDRFCKGRTVIVVAHRLSTVMSADQIVALDKGRVAECGTHAELTARKGVYYSLVKNQLELGES